MEKFPDFAVYRHADSRKWFCLLMDPTWSELHLPGSGKTDILEVKCTGPMRKEVQDLPGILPAYHMNKENWMSILVDGTVPAALVEKLLKNSYEETKQ